MLNLLFMKYLLVCQMIVTISLTILGSRFLEKGATEDEMVGWHH